MNLLHSFNPVYLFQNQKERPIGTVYMPEGLNAFTNNLSLLVLRYIQGLEAFDFAVLRGF